MKHKSATKLQPGLPQASSPETTSARRPDRADLPCIRKILVALDLSPCTTPVIEYAAVFARAFNASLVLLHVIEPAVYPENCLITSSTVEEGNRNIIGASQERLLKMRQQGPLHGLTVEVLVRMGRAYSEIPDTAKATDSDLIILGSQRQADIKHVLVGSTADRVVRQASCPVLMVRSH